MHTEPSFHTRTLDNGLRVVMEVMPHARSAAAGFLARTGARDETRDLAGVSHFLEHMCFKGTQKRDWRQINVEFDEMGSSYNAFTSKERTFYYGWVPADELEQQIELLADMMRSALPPDEFAMEKNVILEEIAMAGDRLEHLTDDLLHERVFGDHPLSWPVLGFTETIEALTRDAMYAYFNERYAADNLVLVVAGNVDPDKVLSTAERLCGSWPASGRSHDRRPAAFRTGTAVQRVERFKQQCIAIAFPTAPSADPTEEAGEAVASILGGENSRFFWHIVQAGIAPRAGAYRMDYAHGGLMVLYGLCEPENCERFVDSLRREAADITDRGVAPHELQRVRNRRRTSLAIEAEAPYYRLVQLMDDVDLHGRPRTVDERLAEVDAVNAESIQEYLERWPITDGGFFVSVGPRNWPDVN